jgi:hypothetical protein
VTRCLRPFLLTLILSGVILLQAAFNGLFIPYARAYFSNGDTLSAHFLISMDTVAENNYREMESRSELDDDDGNYGYKPGDDILPLVKEAYIKANYPLAYFTEMLKTAQFGNFEIVESEDTLRVTDLDSLIYISTQLEAYLEAPKITRHDAALLQQKIYSTVSAEGPLVDYALVSTNPDVTWQEMLILASQYNADPTSGSRLSWYRPAEKQDSLRHYLWNMYQTKGMKALPELTYWAGQALSNLETITPCLNKMDVYSPEQQLELTTGLEQIIIKCRDLYNRLQQLPKQSQQSFVQEIMTSRSEGENYFDIVFPLIPQVNFDSEEDWNKFDDYLNNKGIVVLAWPWD